MLSKSSVLSLCAFLPLAASTVQPTVAPESPAAQAVRAVNPNTVPAPVFAGRDFQRVFLVVTPEPGTWLLLLGGGMGVALLKRRRQAR